MPLDRTEISPYTVAPYTTLGDSKQSVIPVAANISATDCSAAAGVRLVPAKPGYKLRVKRMTLSGGAGPSPDVFVRSVAPAFAGGVIALSPAVYLRLNEIDPLSTVVADSSGNGRDGLLKRLNTLGVTGAAGFAVGALGNKSLISTVDSDPSINFNPWGEPVGAGWLLPYIEVPNSVAFDGIATGSLMFLIQSSAATILPAPFGLNFLTHTGPAVFTQWNVDLNVAGPANHMELVLPGGGTLSFGVPATTVMYNGLPHLVVITWNAAGNANLYLDGVLINTGAMPGPYGASAVPIQLGYPLLFGDQTPNLDPAWNGNWYDEFAMFPAELTGAQILNLFNLMTTLALSPSAQSFPTISLGGQPWTFESDNPLGIESLSSGDFTICASNNTPLTVIFEGYYVKE